MLGSFQDERPIITNNWNRCIGQNKERLRDSKNECPQLLHAENKGLTGRHGKLSEIHISKKHGK